jgi:hypothetical protein
MRAARTTVKKLSDEQILQIVAGSDKAIAESQDRLAPVAGGLCDPDWLVSGVKAGNYSMRELEIGGIPMYRYFFHLNDQNLLDLNAVLFIGSGSGNFAFCVTGAEIIARQFCAKGIIFQTRRFGLLEQGKKWGYQIEGVIMSKKL